MCKAAQKQQKMAQNMLNIKHKTAEKIPKQKGCIWTFF